MAKRKSKAVSRETLLKGLTRKIEFPEISTFREIFSAHDEILDLGTYKSHTTRTWTFPADRGETAEMWLSSFAHVSARGETRYFDVNASAEILAFIDEEMIRVEWDTLNFEIIRWDDGFSLVVVKHGKIIGDRWLAVIRTDSIPGEK